MAAIQPVTREEADAAVAARAAGQPEVLDALCRRILAYDPGHAFASSNLSTLLAEQGRLREAIEVCETAIAHAPQVASNHMNVAHYHLQLKNYRQALRHAREAARLEPDSEQAWVNLSSAAYHAEQFEEAIQASRRVLERDPANFGATTNLATALKGMGRLKESIGEFRRALALSPGVALAHTNLLLTLLYDADTDVLEVVEAAKAYARQFEAPALPAREPHLNTALPHRRLRIGFLSPDFNNHAVMYFAEPVLCRLPREPFEIWCYQTQPVDDFITRRVDSLVDRLRFLDLSQPRKSAQQIQEDGIDILIDLAGHTAKNGLQIMCYKPAPVQVTWLGYPGTTGLQGVDWRITDAVADPEGVDATQYTEGLVRVPGCFCVYRPHLRDVLHRFAPVYQVRPTPALATGTITFGSCNNIAKISDPTLQAWCAILASVPGARLLIEGKDLGNAASSAGLRQRFAERGIAAERLLFVNRDPSRQYLTYHDVDIALDTFPLTGGTTTFDALWMGVPVVSLEGRTFRERLSTTILVNGGFGDEVCKTVEAYVARAAALAADLPALNARRLAQRGVMQASALMNERRFVNFFAQALRQMWQHWCRSQEPAQAAASGPTRPDADVLVPVNGRRVTLGQAEATLERLVQLARTGGQAATTDPASFTRQAAAVAGNILLVCPEHARAAAALGPAA